MAKTPGRTTVPQIKAAGQQLQSRNVVVEESQAFGGVASGAHTGAGHAEGRAIDINIRRGQAQTYEARDPQMKAEFDRYAAQYSSQGYVVIWNGVYWRDGKPTSQTASGHENHMHIEWPANGKGPGTPASDKVPWYGDQSTGPNVDSRPKMDADSHARLRVALDQDRDFYPNFLGDFPNVSYHIKFFMCDAKTIADMSPGDMDPGAVGTMMDGANKVILAESGVTSAISIKEFTFQSVRKNENDMLGTTFEMSLVEPLGTSFYDVTYRAAEALNIPASDITDANYFIELSFKGYDEDGKIVTNLLDSYSPTLPSGEKAPMFANQGRWFWCVSLTTVDTQMTEAGVTHQIKFSTGTLPGAAGRDGRQVPEMMTVKGRNIGEFLNNLKEQLNTAHERRYGLPMSTFDFKFEDNPAVTLSSHPSQWSLIPSEKGTANPVILTLEDGIPAMQITSARSIPDIITGILANTKEAQDLAKNEVRITDSARDGKPQARRQITLQTTVDVKKGQYERIYGQYRKQFTYRISPYFQNSVITDPVQTRETAENPQVQKDMIAELRKHGLMRKRFDYYYTGMNTEIINMDIKFQLAWGAVLTNILGFNYNRAQHTTQALHSDDPVAEARRLSAEMNRILGQKNAIVENIANAGSTDTVKSTWYPTPVTTNATSSTPSAGRVNISEEQAKVRQLDAQYDATRAQFNSALAKVNGLSEQDSANIETIYAEDIPVDPNSDGTVFDPFKIRIVQAPADIPDQTGTGTAHPYHRDRALFGAIMEQVAGDVATMMTLDMDIKGDPYWIGSGNIQRSSGANEDPQVAAYKSGEIMFLLKVSYPFNTDPDSGAGNFRSFKDDGYRKDAFTGFYRVLNVTNKFSEGTFTQSLNCSRHLMANIVDHLGYSGVEDELSSEFLKSQYQKDGDIGSGETGTAPGTTSASPATTTEQQNQYMKVLYDKFIAMGWTPEAANVMVGQIGREGDFKSSNLFGTHTDANNGKTNGGIVSWQGDRRTKLNAYLSNKGLIQNGAIVPGDATLQAQAEFLNQEMKTGYPAAYAAVTTPGKNYSQVETTLSNNYIGWDRAGKGIGASGAANGLQKIRSYYERSKQVNGGS